MFEGKNRIDPDSIKNTEEPISENKLEADIAEQEDSRFSRKVYKLRALVAVVTVLIILTVVNWGTVTMIADYVGSLFNGGISNNEGITVFPEGYSEIYSKIQTLSSEDSSNSDNNESPSPDNDSVMTEIESWKGSDVFESCLKRADVIEVDGDYLYAVSSGYISILYVKDGTITELSRISKNEEDSLVPFEIYLLKKRLVVLSLTSSSANEQECVVAEIYNITDKTNPVLLNTAGQSGEYLSSYMIDDTLYLISKHKVNNAEEKNPETFVPVLFDDDKENAVDYSDICIYNNIETPEYTVVTGINAGKDGKIISNKSLLGYGASIYMDAESLYITSYRQKCTEEKAYNSTDITRLELNKGKIKFKASGNVPGYVMGSSAISEQWDTLRVVTMLYGTDRENLVQNEENTAEFTTDTESKYVPDDEMLDDEFVTCLYILNMDLEVVGKLEDMFPNEKVYSTVFSGAKLYLTVGDDHRAFIVDLIKSNNPEIVDEKVEVSAIPVWMKLYSDEFAVGFESNEDGTGICISMYQISEMKGLVLKDQLILEEHSILEFNPDLVIVDEESEHIVLIIDGKCIVCSFSDEKLVFVEEVELSTDFDGYVDGMYDGAAGIIEDGYMYIFAADIVQVYNVSNFVKCDAMMLK